MLRRRPGRNLTVHKTFSMRRTCSIRIKSLIFKSTGPLRSVQRDDGTLQSWDTARSPIQLLCLPSIAINEWRIYFVERVLLRGSVFLQRRENQKLIVGSSDGHSAASDGGNGSDTHSKYTLGC